MGGVAPTVGVPLEMRYLLLLGLLLTSFAHAGGEPEFQIEQLQRQAIAGDAYAQLNLGAAFDNGFGVRRDHEQAFYWYRAAAEQGVAEAQFNLGHLYASGLGVPQSYRTAAEWLERAAEQGVVDAAYLLGVIHRDGLGVEPDFGVAHRWFSQAARGGQSDAVRALQALKVK